MRSIYENALQVQDACNLSGVVHSFSKDISLVWEEVKKFGGGTEEVNKHPVCILYATQIAHLVGFAGGSLDQYQHAHAACEHRVKVSDHLIEQRKKAAVDRYCEWTKQVNVADNDGWQADGDCYHVMVWFEDGTEGTFNVHFVPGTSDVQRVAGDWSDAAPVSTS